MHDPRGHDVLHDPLLNQSTGFTRDERVRLGLRGLLPHRVSTLEEQCNLELASLRSKSSDIERYIFLTDLQDRNESLFYALVRQSIEETMPLIYTPTVGEACKRFGNIFRRTRGFYVTPEDRGQVRALLDNWDAANVRIVVVTDGQRILGLGDLGANGMGIPIGKLSLYTACARIPAEECLPIMLDVGTNNEELRASPEYLGWPHVRVEGEEYDALVEELVTALQDKYPDVLIQFEDFVTRNAHRLLDEYRNRVLCFNDDIQGTAAVALAGVLAATRVLGVPFRELRILFLGAGSAATGIGGLMASTLQDEGLTEVEARERLWFVDSKGLVVKSREGLADHKQEFVQDQPPLDFMEALRQHRPHVLIGSTGSPATFTEEVVRLMAELNERPVIFALSNPTSRAECTADQAYRWSGGRALFASGSPFDPVELDGKRHVSGQGNNVYIFPGVGLGALAVRARSIPDALFLTAARTLAECVDSDDLQSGTLYPQLHEIGQVSLGIARAVAAHAVQFDVSGAASLDEAAIDAAIAVICRD